MTDEKIRRLLRMAEQALRDSRDAERWAQAGLHDDKDGTSHQAWVAAQKTSRELGRLINELKGLASA